MYFHNPVQARLWRDLKKRRQLDLSKHSPAFPCPSALSVSIRVIRGSFSLPYERLDQPLLYREPGTPAQIIAQGFAIDIQRRG